MKITSLLKSIIVVLALSITTLTHAQEATNQIPEVSTMEELFNALGDKESIQVLFKNLEPKFVTKNLYIDAYMPDEKTLINSSKVIPSKADVIGTYKFVEDYNGYRFVFDSIINIHSFHCLNYTKEYYNQTKESIALETITAITPMIVTAIDGNNVFVQYKNLDKTPCNDMLSINGKHSLTLGDKIELIIGDAKQVLSSFNPSNTTIPSYEQPLFDLAFIDADKKEYCDYLDLVLPIMRPGGWILADNTLWDGHIIDPAYDKDKQTIALRAFNNKVMQDERLEKVILPLRDGLTIIRKKDTATS
jgi:hypothetical protein